MLSRDISMIPAHGIGGGQGIIGQPVVLRDLSHQRRGRLPVRKLFSQKRVEHGTGSIQSLKLILDIQGVKNVGGVIHRQMGAVGVVRSIPLSSRGADIRPALPVVFGQTVRRGLRRRRLQVKQFPVCLLVIRKPVSHMIQYLFCKFLGSGIRHICADPAGIQSCLVHAHQPDGGKMIVEASQIPAGIGIQPLIQQPGDHFPLRVQGTGRHIHQMIQPGKKLLFISGQISDPGHVDGHHTHGTSALSRAEIPSRLFPQFPQIQTQAAAHAPHIAGLHIAVDIVGKIRSAVFGCHLKQQTVVGRIGPVKIRCDGIGGDGVLESPAIGISLDHSLDKRPVDHIHLFFAVLIAEIHFLSAHNGRQLRQILRHRPVQRDIGKGRLGSPAAGGVHPINKGLNALLHFRIGQMIRLHERSQIGVKGRKGLGPGPFVLHDAQKVHHLIAENAQMLCRSGRNLSLDAAQPLLDQLLQGPARTVSGEHGKIVDVDIRVSVGVRNLLVIDLGKPVIGRHCPGVAENQPAHGIGDRGILLDSPVLHLHITVDNLLIVQNRGLHVADLFPLAAVKDIGLRHLRVATLAQHRLHTVLNILHGNLFLRDFTLKIRRHPKSHHIQHILAILEPGGLKSLSQRLCNFSDLKIGNLPVPFYYMKHTFCLSFRETLPNLPIHRRSAAGGAQSCLHIFLSVTKKRPPKTRDRSRIFLTCMSILTKERRDVNSKNTISGVVIIS